jgi:hypothetical protein
MRSGAPLRLTDEAKTVKGTAVKIVSSADATKIGYDQQGDGPALILVDGAMQARSTGAPSQARAIMSAPES